MTDTDIPTEHDRAIRAEELAAEPGSAVAAVRRFLARRRDLGRSDVLLHVEFEGGFGQVLTGHQLDRLITAATTPDPAPTQAAPTDHAALTRRIEQALRDAEVVYEDDDMRRARSEFGYRSVSEVAAEIATALADWPGAAVPPAEGGDLDRAARERVRAFLNDSEDGQTLENAAITDVRAARLRLALADLQDPAPTPTPTAVSADRAAPPPSAAVLTDRGALAAAVERGLRDARVVDEDNEIMGAGMNPYFPVSEVAARVVDALVAPATPTITVGQTITTAAQLTACLPGTAVRTQAGLLAERLDRGRWRLAGVAGDYATDGLSLPARVLDLPNAATATGGGA